LSIERQAMDFGRRAIACGGRHGLHAHMLTLACRLISRKPVPCPAPWPYTQQARKMKRHFARLH
jgi:hypothetical protein